MDSIYRRPMAGQPNLAAARRAPLVNGSTGSSSARTAARHPNDSSARNAGDRGSLTVGEVARAVVNALDAGSWPTSEKAR